MLQSERNRSSHAGNVGTLSLDTTMRTYVCVRASYVYLIWYI